MTQKDGTHRTVIGLSDSKKQLDMELSIMSLDELAVKLDLILTNRSLQDIRLDRIDVLSGRLMGGRDPERNRVLLNGDNSWARYTSGRLQEKGEWKSYYTIAIQTPTLAAGFLTGKHNINHFLLTNGSDGLVLTAWGECNGCVLKAGKTRKSDSLFLSANANPLQQMERFADLAAVANKVKPWPENFATWCSWYSGWIRQKPLYDYKGGLEKGVETQLPFVKRLFGRRGGASMRIVDDSYDMPYGDWYDTTKAITRSFSRLASMMNDFGIRPGVWYTPYLVSTKSRFFQEHKNWLAQNEDGTVYHDNRGLSKHYHNDFTVIDTSHPDALAHFEKTARMWRDRGFRYVMTDFLMWGTFASKYHDPTLTRAEVYYKGLTALRHGFGKEVYWLNCGALLGPAMGLCDGMRISGDSHGDEIYSYQWAGGRWFYNHRIWLNDPDAIVCVRYGKEKSVEWNRMWMSWMALSGAVLTYGEALDDLPPRYINLYKRILPPMNIAGRPLDFWENDPCLLWGLVPGEADGKYELLGVFNFKGDGKKKVILNLDEISARCRGWEKPKNAPSHYLLWDFWQQKLIEAEGAKLGIVMPAKSCRVFALRSRLDRPQLLSTSGHFSQGVIETSGIRWDSGKAALSGQARGNGGHPTTLFFHIPDGMRLQKATLGCKSCQVRMLESDVISLDISATEQQLPFELIFTGTAIKKSSIRPFVPGLAAIVEKSEAKD